MLKTNSCAAVFLMTALRRRSLASSDIYQILLSAPVDSQRLTEKLYGSNHRQQRAAFKTRKTLLNPQGGTRPAALPGPPGDLRSRATECKGPRRQRSRNPPAGPGRHIPHTAKPRIVAHTSDR